MVPTTDKDFWKGVQGTAANRRPTYNVNSKDDMEKLIKMLEVGWLFFYLNIIFNYICVIY